MFDINILKIVLINIRVGNLYFSNEIALADIIKEITGAVDEVKDEVEVIDSEFKKAVGKSVEQPIEKKEIKQSKQSSLTDRFFGNK